MTSWRLDSQLESKLEDLTGQLSNLGPEVRDLLGLMTIGRTNLV